MHAVRRDERSASSPLPAGIDAGVRHAIVATRRTPGRPGAQEPNTAAPEAWPGRAAMRRSTVRGEAAGLGRRFLAASDRPGWMDAHDGDHRPARLALDHLEHRGACNGWRDRAPVLLARVRLGRRGCRPAGAAWPAVAKRGLVRHRPRHGCLPVPDRHDAAVRARPAGRLVRLARRPRRHPGERLGDAVVRPRVHRRHGCHRVPVQRRDGGGADARRRRHGQDREGGGAAALPVSPAPLSPTRRASCCRSPTPPTW